MSPSKFDSHMETLVQTQKMDQLEQEVHELRGEVTTLRAEVERLTSLVSSLMAAKDPPLVQQRSQSLSQPMCMKRPRQQVAQQAQSFTTQNQVPQPFITQNQAPQPFITQNQAPQSFITQNQAPRLSTTQNQAPQSFTSQNRAPQQLILQNQAWKESQFDPFPIKYATLLHILLKKKFVQNRPLHWVPNPLPSWYCPDLKCDFHQGAPGHDTEQCYSLKEEVQKLIDNNPGFFEDPDIKVLLQQQHLAPRSVVAVRPANIVHDPGNQPQFQPSQQHLASHSVVAVRPINVVQDPGYQPQSQQYQQQPRQQTSRKQIDHIPMTYAKLFPKLLERNLVYTKAPSLVPAKLTSWYRPDLFCAFHQGAPGHDIEHCFALQKIVQKLIQKNLIPFEEF